MITETRKLDEILSSLREHYHCPVAMAGIIRKGVYDHVAVSGVPMMTGLDARSLPCGLAVHRRLPVVIEDLEGWDALAGLGLKGGAEPRFYAGARFDAPDGAEGVVALLDIRPRPMALSELGELTEAAVQLAVAVHETAHE